MVDGSISVNEKPIVSVLMITYKQEQFIKQAIEGVLIQKTKFPIELIVANDCSPDNSDRIINDVLDSAPSHIAVNYIFRDVNMGVNLNFADAIQKAKGKYIAVCEGDDYWTDPFKLQKQVDFLNKNKDCNLVYHRVMVYDEEAKVFSKETLNHEEIETKRTLETLTLSGNFMHTPSVVFRNNIDVQSKLFDGNVVGDYILWFLNGEKGLYGYLPEYMAVYRIWNGGIWSKKRRATTHFIFANMLTRLSKHSNSAVISSNLRQQSIDTLLRIGFSEMSVKEKINFTYFILRYDKRPLRTLVKKISEKLNHLFRGD